MIKSLSHLWPAFKCSPRLNLLWYYSKASLILCYPCSSPSMTLYTTSPHLHIQLPIWHSSLTWMSQKRLKIKYAMWTYGFLFFFFVVLGINAGPPKHSSNLAMLPACFALFCWDRVWLDLSGLASSLWSSCLHLLIDGIIDMHQHTEPLMVFSVKHEYLSQRMAPSAS